MKTLMSWRDAMAADASYSAYFRDDHPFWTKGKPEMNTESINIDDLLLELASRNLPVCDRAIYAIAAMRGKRTIIKGADEPDVEVEEPAPVTLKAAAALNDA